MPAIMCDTWKCYTTHLHIDFAAVVEAAHLQNVVDLQSKNSLILHLTLRAAFVLDPGTLVWSKCGQVCEA